MTSSGPEPVVETEADDHLTDEQAREEAATRLRAMAPHHRDGFAAMLGGIADWMTYVVFVQDNEDDIARATASARALLGSPASPISLDDHRGRARTPTPTAPAPNLHVGVCPEWMGIDGETGEFCPRCGWTRRCHPDVVDPRGGCGCCEITHDLCAGLVSRGAARCCTCCTHDLPGEKSSRG